MPGGKHGRSATDRDLRREGGSSKPKSPVEASDSLKLLIAVGEGEFDSVPTDYDIYLDNTPIRDASGNYNIPNVKWGCARARWIRPTSRASRPWRTRPL